MNKKLNIEKNIYYINNPKYFNELYNLIRKNPFSYFSRLRQEQYKHIYDWIEEQVYILNDPFYKITTKCYWIMNNIVDFPICDTCGKQIKRNCGLRGYSEGKSNRIHCANKGRCANNDKYKLLEFEKHCLEKFNLKTPFLDMSKRIETSLKKYGTKYPCQSEMVKNNITKAVYKKYGVTCVFKNESIKNKIRETNSFKYGVDYPAQNYQILIKQKKKYFYNNTLFDSSWELAYYIWLQDNKIKFEYHPNIYFEYTTQDNKTHKYFPDFLIDNKLYEIKGDQFFAKDGSPKKFSKYPWFEKYNCIIKNNIKILLFSDIKEQYDYCRNKFKNKNWYLRFKYNK